MTPGNLQSDSFQNYPPDARELGVKYIELLRNLPVSFLPLLLRELIAYDYKFPIEKKELDHQLG
jgi:hypothetical protein